jgi:PIN domain nuclease of toxin-antitoxin system
VEARSNVIHLDTHVVVWLYAGNVRAISPRIASRIDDDDLVISPAVGLEIDFLHEIGKVTESSQTIITDLTRRLGLRFATTPFSDVVSAASPLRWTRDPFDRLIVGQAIVENADLATRDRVIRRHYSGAIWK